MATSTNLDLIRSIRKRTKSQPFGYGIGVASSYLDAIKPCLSNEECFSRMMPDVSVSQWDALCKSATKRLTFSEQDSLEQKSIVGITGSTDIKAMLSEVVGGVPELPAHCALVFRNIVTTNKEDRDRDILLPMGATVDKSMPLLWQHLQPQPIGKMLGVICQNEKMLRVLSCICDVSPLCGDVIKMVEAMILRISHGFKPKEFSALQTKQGDQVPAGFLVSKYEIVEESVVSVPSNSEAEIDAWSSLVSRKSFKTDIVKALGARMYELRSTANQSAGGLPERIASNDITIKVVVENNAKSTDQSCSCSLKSDDVQEETASEGESESVETEASENSQKTCPICSKELDQTATCESCGYVTGKSLPEAIAKSFGIQSTDFVRISRFEKQHSTVNNGSVTHSPNGEKAILLHVVPDGVKSSYDMPRSSKLFANIEGSFEWISDILSHQVRKFMLSQSVLGNVAYNPDSPDWDWCWLEATMSDHVVVGVSGRQGDRYYKVAWSSVDGKPTISMDASITEVEATAVVRDTKLTQVSTKTFSREPMKQPESTQSLIKSVSAFCVMANASDLKELSEIASIANITAEGIRSENESRELERELSRVS